jgi:hypothetical protein
MNSLVVRAMVQVSSVSRRISRHTAEYTGQDMDEAFLDLQELNSFSQNSDLENFTIFSMYDNLHL